MKELKQTNKIFIAGVIFFSLILVGILTTKKPTLPYQMSAKDAVALIGNTEKMISVNDIKNADYQLVDVRNQFEYANGHIDNATNIYAPDLFESFSIRFLKQVKKDGRKVLLYGQDIHEAADPWMILSQLGLDNVYYLKEGYKGYELAQANKSLASIKTPEKPDLDYAQFFVDARLKIEKQIAEAKAAAAAARKAQEAKMEAARRNKEKAKAAAPVEKVITTPTPVKPKKKVIKKVRKKKKRKVGGC